jgi:uncharacterized protein (DUF2147 family)
MRFLVCFLLAFIANPLFSSDKVMGFWKTIDDRKGFTTSIIAVYKYDYKIYGRVIVAYDEKSGDLIDTLYNPKQYIDDKVENSFLCSSNLFWDLEWDLQRWRYGIVLDPRNGKVFKCQVWEEDGVLILRGTLGIFGQNQLFFPVVPEDFPPGFDIPDINSFIPVLPEY